MAQQAAQQQAAQQQAVQAQAAQQQATRQQAVQAVALTPLSNPGSSTPSGPRIVPPPAQATHAMRSAADVATLGQQTIDANPLAQGIASSKAGVPNAAPAVEKPIPV